MAAGRFLSRLGLSWTEPELERRKIIIIYKTDELHHACHSATRREGAVTWTWAGTSRHFRPLRWQNAVQ